jgi:glycosyltransferase involved in cell wall biosynthesis
MIESLARSVAFEWIEMARPDAAPAPLASRLSREFEYRRCFRDAAMKAKGVDLVIIPYLDYCFHAMALTGSPFGDTPWAAITMRLTHVPGLHTRRLLLRRLLRDPHLRLLFSLTALDARWQRIRGTSKLRYLPDPGDLREPMDRDAARRDLGIPADALVILVYGTIDDRKGLVQLVEALASAAAPSAVLLVVGRQSAEIRKYLATPRFTSIRGQGRLIEVDQFVDDATQAGAFAAADVVWLGYVGHLGMSGVLVLAGLARRAVIATSAGELGRLAREHLLGPVVDVGHAEQIVAALRAVKDPELRARFAESCHRTFEAHEAARVGREFFQSLRLPRPAGCAGVCNVPSEVGDR